MTCLHTLWGAADGLHCLRTDVHATGHIYSSSWAADAHDESERLACA